MTQGAKYTQAGWICAAVVLALFGLQQVFPLRELLMLKSGDAPAMKALHAATCLLVHGSFLHAAVNSLSFICLFLGVKKGMAVKPGLAGLIAGWMATFLFAVFLMPRHATLVGSSGMLFGMLGFFMATDPFSRWRFCGVGSIPLIVLAPVLVAVDGMTAILFLKCVAWPVHAVAFSFGAIIGTIKWPEQASV